jgi:hypothetical protein
MPFVTRKLRPLLIIFIFGGAADGDKNLRPETGLSAIYIIKFSKYI